MNWQGSQGSTVKLTCPHCKRTVHIPAGSIVPDISNMPLKCKEEIHKIGDIVLFNSRQHVILEITVGKCGHFGLDEFEHLPLYTITPCQDDGTPKRNGRSQLVYGFNLFRRL